MERPAIDADRLERLARSLANGGGSDADAAAELAALPEAARELVADIARALGERILDLERREGKAQESAHDLRQMLEGYTRAKRKLKEENQRLRAEVDPARRPIIGAEGGLRDIMRLVERVADTPIPVLITGESGTGKEVIARHLHARGSRADGPFVAVNCAAIPEGLLESELFGIKKAVATGVAERRGRIEEAAGGTLLLDEVGDMPPAMQAKILRVLQEREVVPVGGREPVPVDVRFVSATNRDLQAEVRAHRFREDLYYRVVGVHIHLPPLRERSGDIDDLVSQHLGETARRFGRNVRAIGPEALEALRRYRWPGNVRELIAEVERAVAVAEGDTVSLDDLTPRVAAASGRPPAGGPGAGGPSIFVAPTEIEKLRDARLRFERRYIEWAIERAGSRRRAAPALGVTREGLRRKLQALGMPPYEDEPRRAVDSPGTPG